MFGQTIRTRPPPPPPPRSYGGFGELARVQDVQCLVRSMVTRVATFRIARGYSYCRKSQFRFEDVGAQEHPELNPRLQTPNPKPHTLHPTPYTLHPKQYTLNATKPQNPKPETSLQETKESLSLHPWSKAITLAHLKVRKQ